MKVMVETSARHVHVTQETLEKLFGAGATLTKKKELSQPGQFASMERITIVGPKGEMKNVSILGPVRKADQVELSLTDLRKIGIAAPVRESGEVDIEKGVIAAKRHIHFTPEDAEKFGVKDKQIVSVEVGGEGRKLIFGDVVVRVSESYAAAMHIDTDESNAAGLPGTVEGEVIVG